MKNNWGFNLQLNTLLIIIHWNKNIVTTSGRQFSVWGIRSHHSKEGRHLGLKSQTKPQSISSICEGKTTHSSKILMASSGRMLFWSSKSMHWRRWSWNAQLQTKYPSCNNRLYTNTRWSTISAFDGGLNSSFESCQKSPKAGRNNRWRPAKSTRAGQQ